MIRTTALQLPSCTDWIPVSKETSMVTLPIPQLSLPEQVAWQAQFIVNHLRQTDYQFIEKIDMDRGVYDCDCNGFVGFVLQLCVYHHYKMIPKEPNQPRPRAFKYYEFFVSPTLPSTGGWQRIVSLAEARRGDILAWRFPTVDSEEKKQSGHCLPPGQIGRASCRERVEI